MKNFAKMRKFRAQGCPLGERPLFVLSFILLFTGTLYAEDVQGPAVAGSFYPKDKAALEKAVDKYIDDAKVDDVRGDIVAIIAPHAGYQYSGWVGGYAFKPIKDMPIETVIIVAPSHSHSFNGLSVLDKDSYLTPLGKVPIDKKLTRELIAFDKRIKYLFQPFLEEHAAEVEIPFLQKALRDFKIVVILTGGPSYDNCTLLRDALTKTLKGRDGMLIVASTDMSHYHPDARARSIDAGTLKEINKFDPESLFLKLSSGESELCGSGGVVGVMMAARNLGADSVKTLKYATSGDVSGDKRRVVGYCAVALYKSTTVKNPETQKEKEMEGLLNAKQKKRLLEIARSTIESHIKEGKVPELKEDDPLLNEEMGAFVTLHQRGQLRGCIGNMIGKGPLCLTVRDMAIAASTQDPRFPPVKKEEVEDIDIEISVLSPMEKIDDPNKIVMGKHGVMVQDGFRSGVYLPQVATETGWSREEFMNSLCMSKAGLAADSWKKGTCDIYVFTAEVFGEK